MIVVTEVGRYRVDELARGRFRISIIEVYAHALPDGYDHTPLDETWEVPALRLKVGVAFHFTAAGQQIEDSALDRITAIEP